MSNESKPRPLALAEIVDGLRKRVASAHEAIAQCSKDRESCPPDDRCDDCEAEQQLIVLLDAAIARLAEQSQAEKVWADLAALVGCTSPDGSAELEQVKDAIAKQETLERERDVFRQDVEMSAARAESAEARLEQQNERTAPVQGYAPGIPWAMHLRAYAAYAKRYSPQRALIEGDCRGGFHADELDIFIPGWREELSGIHQLRAKVARLEQSEQERGEMKPTETCSVCGHAAHRRGDCWVAVGLDKHGDDAMCPCIAHILAATPSPEEP